MGLGKFKYNDTNLEFLANEAWKSNKTLAVRYKGTIIDNFIELLDRDEEYVEVDICVNKDSFSSNKEFKDYIKMCINK